MIRGMRWQPDARGRLEQAAMELYSERGFEQTTVAEIAQRAGLTERTFFRHYADKREVLFAGAEFLQVAVIDAVAATPESPAPMDAAMAGLAAAATLLEQRREFARRRHWIIASSPELRERELIKLASLGGAVAATLRERGVAEPAASLTGEVAMAVFRIAFERWTQADEGRRLSELIAETLGELTSIATTA